MKAFTNAGGGITLVLSRQEAELVTRAIASYSNVPQRYGEREFLHKVHSQIAGQISKLRRMESKELFSALETLDSPPRYVVTYQDPASRLERRRRIGWEAW